MKIIEKNETVIQMGYESLYLQKVGSGMIQLKAERAKQLISLLGLEES
ncbi:hypothetical protein [Lysinibacillus cavernae]|nr:hypothetical protein [Lysinibacillus cavernae]